MINMKRIYIFIFTIIFSICINAASLDEAKAFYNNKEYKFCPECGAKKPEAGWKCACGAVNKGKFCSECGKKR